LKFIEFLKLKLFWLNVLAAIVVFVVLVSVAMSWLSGYTLHGETITVPDLKGMSLEQVKQHLKSKNLRNVKLREKTPIIGVWDNHDYGKDLGISDG
jgi:predicted MPP superfamily phosphohydrolase